LTRPLMGDPFYYNGLGDCILNKISYDIEQFAGAGGQLKGKMAVSIFRSMLFGELSGGKFYYHIIRIVLIWAHPIWSEGT
jgi:hypothetical protein